MKFRSFFFILFYCLSLISCSKPEPVFHDTQGQLIQFSKLQGKWIIINYWAPWCHSCVKEIPELNRFYKSHPDVIFYGVSFDRKSSEELKQSIKKLNIQFPVIVENPAEALHLNEIDIIPATFILDSKGKVVKIIERPVSEKMLSDQLQELKK